MTRFFILFLYTFLAFSVLAQPANDACSNAIPILNPTDFCTGFGIGSNFGATDEGILTANCMPGSVEDVWYSFQAVASNATITVNGASFNGPGGDVQQPSMALYTGDCTNLELIGCVTDISFASFIEYNSNSLIPGQFYYIRVDNASGQGGSFELCILNFNPVPPPDGDCPTAVPICNNEPFVVEAVSGVGNDPNELADASCFMGIVGESASTWYTFTAATSGPMTFSLTPNNPGDDLDFVVYHLPNGSGDCTGKEVVRCMAAGGFDSSSPCMGPTGLEDGQIDLSNQPGCIDEQNNFLAPLDLVAGESYAIAVNNFTQSGSGFSFSWGGTATFIAPEVSLATDMTQDTVCSGTQITFTETIVYDTTLITINDIYWFFGTGATPISNAGVGPQTATYNTPGSYIATMTVDAGCYITLQQAIVVEQCCAATTVSIAAENVSCFGQNDASATATMQSGILPFTFDWSDGQTESTAANLAAGTYTCTVTDDIGCTSSATVTITQPVLLDIAASQGDTINLGETIDLNVTSNTDSTTFVWTGGGFSGTGSTVSVQPTETTTYYVIGSFGSCTDLDTVIIVVDPVSLKVPTAFSPNSDDLNDTFGPLAVGVDIITFRVWDRWGAMLHDNPATLWDGTRNGAPMPADAYLFYIVARYPDGTEKKIEGDVTLLR